MASLVLLSAEEIVEINRSLGYSVLNPGSLDFLSSKLKSSKYSGDLGKDVSRAAAIAWHEIIHSYPFVDGNKRTAAETALLIIQTNGFRLDMPPNGVIYLSLRIANSDIKIDKLRDEINKRLEVNL